MSQPQTDVDEVLHLLLNIPPHKITADLNSTPIEIELLRREEKSHRNANSELFTAEEIAVSYHRRLILASYAVEHSRLAADLILFFVSLPVYEIAELACTVACDKGKLAELTLLFDQAEISDDFTEFDQAAAAGDRLLTTIHDTVFVDILRRYDFHQFLNLFERNRPLYEIRNEVGRRLINPDHADEAEDQNTTAGFRAEYGPRLAQEFTRRLGQHGLLQSKI